MNRYARLALIAAGTLAAAGVGYRLVDGRYLAPRAQLIDEIARYRSGIERAEAEVAKQATLTRRIQEIASTSLGSDRETVDASMRTALNEILARTGLSDTSVDLRAPAPVRSPAAQRRAAEFRAKEARTGVDFWTMSATVKGKGSLVQVIRAMSTIQSQPWAHRVDAFGLRPVGKQREQVELMVTVTTLYLDDRRRPRPEGAPLWTMPADSELARWDALVSKNMFREPPAPPAPPPAPPPAVVAQAPPPPAAPAPPYGEWRVTAIVRGRQGAELWLRNERSNQIAVVPVGGTVLDARLLSAAKETARIEVGGTAFDVALGQTLAERRPAQQ